MPPGYKTDPGSTEAKIERSHSFYPTESFHETVTELYVAIPSPCSSALYRSNLPSACCCNLPITETLLPSKCG